MDFSCACDVGVDESAEMIETRTSKARKEHKCHECQSIISAGESYLVEKEVFDGVFSTHKTCLPCKEVRDRFLYNGFFWSMIWESLRECFDDIPLSDFEEFTPKAQQKILEML